MVFVTEPSAIEVDLWTRKRADETGVVVASALIAKLNGLLKTNLCKCGVRVIVSILTGAAPRGLEQQVVIVSLI